MTSYGPVPPIPELVAIDPVGVERFRGISPVDWPGRRVFGGLVVGQALRAAGCTVEDALPHSLHAYFLRPGRPELPMDHTVTRVRDGRSFSTRSVEVAQAGEVILTMLASFHRPEHSDVDYQLPRTVDSAGPDDVGPTSVEPLPHLDALTDLEVHEVGPTRPEADGTVRSTRRAWLRVAGELPDDPLLHASILAFMSDMGIVVAAHPPQFRFAARTLMAASLDHAIWFHRPQRVDEWMFVDLHSLSVAASRASARGVVHDTDGRLCASVAQESLMRFTTTRRADEWGRGPEG